MGKGKCISAREKRWTERNKGKAGGGEPRAYHSKPMLLVFLMTHPHGCFHTTLTRLKRQLEGR